MREEQIEKWRQELLGNTPLIRGWLQQRRVRQLAVDGSPEAIQVLAEVLVETTDEELRTYVWEILSGVKEQRAIDVVCAIWERTRSSSAPGGRALERLLVERGFVAAEPTTLRVRTALKAGRPELLTTQPLPEMIPPLVAACAGSDPVAARRAADVLREVVEPGFRTYAVEELATRWNATRAPILESLLLELGQIAESPLEIQVLTALKLEQRGVVSAGGAEVVPFLLAACHDADPTIAREARLALRELSDPRAQDAVCRLFIHQDMHLARDAALEGGYVPTDAVQQALFFFLTDQWERYDTLDFDRNLLRIAYAAADAALSRRLREQMRRSGHSDFLTAVAEEDLETRVKEMMESEAELLVQMLTGRHAWERLWELVRLLHFDLSLRIVRILQEQGWRPPQDEGRRLLARLVALASDARLSGKLVAAQLPSARRRAGLQVLEGITDVAFAPAHQLLALGTGDRRVVLWDLAGGEPAQRVDGFQNDVGYVRFTGRGDLICAESTPDIHRPCSIYVMRQGEAHLSSLGGHVGAITSLEPWGTEHFLSTGRDFRVSLWDPEGQVCEQRVRYWARVARVAQGGEVAALLSRVVSFISLPDLHEVARGWPEASMSGCAAFVPGEDLLVVGKYNGEVTLCRRRQREIVAETASLVNHEDRVEAVEVLGALAPLVITGAATGEVVFTQLHERVSIGRLRLPGGALRSLHVDPAGRFLALREDKHQLSLWDLRFLRLPALFVRPLAAASSEDWEALNAVQQASELPPMVQSGLRYVELLLLRNFSARPTSAVPQIYAGEFRIAS